MKRPAAIDLPIGQQTMIMGVGRAGAPYGAGIARRRQAGYAVSRTMEFLTSPLLVSSLSK